MNLPNLPSSSLYRFKAILGLMIISVSMFFIVYLIVDYNEKSIAINSEMETINADVDSLSSKLDEVKSKAIVICEMNNCKCVDEKGVLVSPVFQKGPPLIHHKHKELKELYNQYEQVSKNIRNKRGKINARIHILDNYWEFGNRFFIVVLIVLIIGLIILFTGFRDWKNKIQRYQDAILEEQAAKLNPDFQQIIPKRRRRLMR